MANPHWHDCLRHELEERGLPATYSARLLEELLDHCHDIQRENPSMEAHLSALERLGAPELLAAAAKKEYVKRTFAGRHPFLTFVVGPIVVTQMTWYLLLLLICFPLKTLVTPFEPATMLPPTSFEWFVAYANIYVLRFLPFAVLAPAFLRAGRTCCRPVWGMVACGIVAYMASVNYMHVGPPTEKHNLAVFLSLQFGLFGWQSRLVQAAIPLVVSIWTWRRWGDSGGASCPSDEELAASPLAAATSA
jgi:hypothetical protein